MTGAFSVILAGGVMLTLLLVLLALRRIPARPDLVWAWTAWWLTLALLALALVADLSPPAGPPLATPEPTPPTGS